MERAERGDGEAGRRIEGVEWSARRLWTFRVGVALFGVQLVVSGLDASYGTRAVAARGQEILRGALVAVVPGAVRWVEALAARSDGHAVVLELLRDGVLAVVLAALWTACDRRRRHERLAGAMRVMLRYLLGGMISIYGGLKVIPVQFPPPSAESLLRPLGEQTPMGLLWAFMGVSPAYTVFAGLAEMLGGALLFWRRTTTLGALVLAGVLANVVMLNFAYDVPVKRASTLMLLGALVLASRDFSRLGRVLWTHGAVEPGPEPAFGGGPIARRIRAVLKPAFVTLALAGPIVAGLVVHSRRAEDGPLHGVWAVERFERDGVEVPPLATEPGRWRRLVLGDRGGAVLQTMDDRCERFALAVDPVQGRVTLTGRSGGPELRFRYEGSSGEPLRLVGEGGAIGEVRLRPLSAASVFPVLR